MKKCLWCGKDLEGRSRKYCTKRCRLAAYREELKLIHKDIEEALKPTEKRSPTFYNTGSLYTAMRRNWK